MAEWRKSQAYRVWAYMVKKNKRCVVCGTIKNRHAHQKNHADTFPEQRFDEENGVYMCAKCHRQYHCNYHRSFSEACTEYDFKNFLSLMKYARVMFQKIFLDAIKEAYKTLPGVPYK